MNPDIEALKAKATASAGKLNQATAEGYNIEGELKNKLNDAYNYNQDITNKLDTATSSYLTAPQTAREKYQDIFNPFSREKLVSQYTQGESLPMLSLASILGTRTGNIGDAIKAGTGAYQGYVSGLQGNAALDRTAYEDAVKQYQQQFENDLATKKYNLDASKVGTGSSLGDLIGKNLSIYNAVKPSDTAQTAADKATVARQSINTVKDIIEKDPSALKFASGSGVLNFLGKVRGGGNDDILRQNLTLVKDAFQRIQSGAALSDSERAFYSNFIADPVTAISSTGSTKTAMDLIDSILSKIEKQGRNPKEILSGDYSSLFPNGEIPVRRKSDGQTGYIPISEYDPNLYERMQ